MKQLRWFSLLAVVMLMAAPLSVMAQGDSGKMKEYSTEDGTLTVSYPEEWLVQENPSDTGLYGVTLANSQAVLEKAFAEEDSDFVTGDQAIVIFLLPADFLSMMGMVYDPEASIEEMTQALADALFDTDPEDEDAPKVSEVEVIDLSDDLQAGQVKVVDAYLEGAVIAYEPVEKVIAITYVLAFPGEFNDDLAQIGQDVAATIQYTGTNEDLMALFMGGLSEEDDIEPTMAPIPLDGQALVEERCTVCHTRDRIDAKMKSGADLAEWTETVDEMIAKGAQLNDDERQAVLDYLTSQ